MDRIAKLEKVGERSVKVTFNEKSNREFPLILAAGMPILPKHLIKPKTFDQSSLTLPIGSGPYKVKSVSPGERIVYQRDPNYWGKDIPAKVGFDNYDEISIEYFLQDNTLFEAFKKGAIDIYPEGSPTHWSRAYDFPAQRSGEIVKDVFVPKLPTGMLGFVFNTRREVFANEKLRAGLSLVFDFEWANRTLFEGAYKRTQSLWQNSVLSGTGENSAAGERELALLGNARSRIEPSVLDGTYALPVSDGSGADRKILRQAVDLMKQAGYTIKNGRMVDAKGKPLVFEIMSQTIDQEKLAIAYQRSLRTIGVEVSIRTVDDAQYQSRSGNFDYDMIVKSYPASLSPGAEQQGRWGSSSRDRNGSFNYAGTADPDIDRIINAMLNARSEEDFEAAVRVYDKLLVSGHYMVPLYHIGEQWVARRSYIGHPDKVPLYGYQLPTWWDARVQ
jgi:peptide/nickel transport system substrate-binding protein